MLIVFQIFVNHVFLLITPKYEYDLTLSLQEMLHYSKTITNAISKKWLNYCIQSFYHDLRKCQGTNELSTW